MRGQATCVASVTSPTTLLMPAPCKYCSQAHPRPCHSNRPHSGSRHQHVQGPPLGRCGDQLGQRHLSIFVCPGTKAGAHSPPATSGTSVQSPKSVDTGPGIVRTGRQTQTTKCRLHPGRQDDVQRGYSLDQPQSAQQVQYQSNMERYPDRHFVDYILSGICNGVHIGVDRTLRLHRARSGNLPSVREHPSLLDHHISERAAGRLLGPLPAQLASGCQISPIGLIPKPHQPEKWRQIVELSC